MNAMRATHTLDRPASPESREEQVTRTTDEPAGAPITKARLRDANGMAVASFVLGLAGLLVFNLVLGPCALVLAGLALLRGTNRRARAVLGLTLGAADLIVLASVSATDHAASWSITG